MRLPVAVLSLSLTALLSSVQRSSAIYSHYEHCSDYLIGNEKRSAQLCPTEIEEAEMADSAVPIIDVFPNFVDGAALEEIEKVIAEAQEFRRQHQLTQRFISHVDIGADLVAKMRGAAGFLPVADRTTLPAVSVEGKSSVPHIDCYANELTNEMEEIMDPNDRVGFLWIGDHSEGTGQFRYGDTTLPIKPGTFLHFRGDIPHYTILPDGGSVSMLGPFALASPKPIGSVNECSYVNDCRDYEGDDVGIGHDCKVPPVIKAQREEGSNDGICICTLYDDELDFRRKLSRNDDSATSSTTKKDSDIVLDAIARKLSKNGKAGKAEGMGKATKSPKGNKSSKCCFSKCIASKEDSRRLLDVSYDPSPEEAFQVAEETGGNLDAKLIQVTDVLSPEECKLLVDYTIKAETKHEDTNDKVVPIREKEPIETILGAKRTRELFQYFKDNTDGAPITQIWLRRMTGGGQHGHTMKLHKDEQTMLKIALNDNFEGGETAIVDRSGNRKLTIEKGSGILHHEDLIHGHMPLRGDKYMMYIISDAVPDMKDMAEDILAE